ncbi:MAG: helix-turn-helix transcriptional regulator, partial [Acidobacteriota bacterium]|nr:helix-turn-helix transcriptional regulator [Acidobacteriota bacterium]
MRAYREAYVSPQGNKGLTQEELLRRMAAVDREYGERFSHATVSRWESGSTRPTAHRLKVFGEALGLTSTEVAGLLLLAGLAPDFESALVVSTGAGRSRERQMEESPAPEPNLAFAGSPEFRGSRNTSSILMGAMRLLATRWLPLATFTVLTGYTFSVIGWDDSWMPIVFISLVTALVLIQGLILPEPENRFREFLWVTLFFLMTTPLIQFAPVKMDHYGLNAIDGISGTFVPYMLALLVNLSVASVAGVMFHVLWGFQNSGNREETIALRRAAIAVVPPVALVYLVAIVFSNTSIFIQYALVLPPVAATFTAMLALRDPSVQFTERRREFLLSMALAIIFVTSILGSVALLGIFLSPDYPMILPDHSLLGSWEIDLAGLGYTRAEALDHLNLGYLWHALTVFAYLELLV